MRSSWCSFRSTLVFIISGSLVLSPAIPAYVQAQANAGNAVIAPTPVVGPNPRLLLPPLLPGIPVPGHVVGPGSPVVGKRYKHHRPHGSVHRYLPAGAFALSVAGAAFFFHMGNYYRHTPTGYVVVQAPFGARVRSLPESCSTLYIDGSRYYDCDDVYYKMDGDEYIVIERPSGRQAEVDVGDEVRINTESLNVRSGPGKRYQTVSKLYRGDIVEIGGMDGEWYSVRLSDGRNGWIMREYTRLHKSRNDAKG